MLFPGIGLPPLQSLFGPCYENHILSTGTLIRSLWPISGPVRPSPVITMHATTSQVYSQRLACSGEEFLIPIRRRVPRYKNSPRGSSSLFSWPGGGWSDLDEVEGVADCGVPRVWLDVGSAVSEAKSSTFWG